MSISFDWSAKLEAEARNSLDSREEAKKAFYVLTHLVSKLVWNFAPHILKINFVFTKLNLTKIFSSDK